MRKSYKYFSLMMVLILLSGFIGLGGVASTGQLGNIQPILAQIAAASPEQQISVIIQTAGGSDQIEGVIESLGGAVTRDLSIISAVSAEVPGKAVPELAKVQGVRWVSLDAPVISTAKGGNGGGKPPSDPDPPYIQTHLDTLNVRDVWDMDLDGEGVTVAVIDSGIAKVADFNVKVKGGSPSRILRQMSFSPDSTTVNDVYGHGTHVAGIIGGNGKISRGDIIGVAPKVNLVSLKISDEQGMAYESDTVAAMQWVLENKETFNIRVVNLSVNSTMEQSYHTSPMNAAAEILWFNSIVVVASAGNNEVGSGLDSINTAPANDPFIITVGASDEGQTPDKGDDIVAVYSAHGTTTDGYGKPDIIAPGQDIISLLSLNSTWSYEHPLRVLGNGDYFRLSGTSMAAPMVTGAAALLLQDEPELTPDQVKYRLMYTGSQIDGGDGDSNIYAYLDVLATVTGTTTESANTGNEVSALLTTGSEPINWGSVNWNSVNWNSVNWNSVNWNSVNWNSVNWNSVAWDH
jgi:serine protease AprX